ncbi:DUF2520 domain-containing protein [Gordonia sp. PDNC005]|uniref:Rossmann-like and DUF2520 domain-containing protein n=1 Tax=unclassified Gordonia (in: high G+C Gram-positive bacteria) TaxID=2657482 RepID=UPI001963F500|nr:DUF2520 domain-containing protein [Gordonia sp. PDNC005]QRY61904.1 DUF2520 domain-containing protein [Gordonia sp. PDNC005]
MRTACGRDWNFELEAAVNSPTAPARLRVGIVSAGRVGTALGEALAAAGHRVTSVVANSLQSLSRAQDRLPSAEIRDLPALVELSDLIVVAVPDTVLADVAAQIADVDTFRPGTIVTHTAGAHGVDILAPIARRGGIVLATHPAMTFVGTREDTARLSASCFGVTAADEIGDAIAMALVLELGATPIRIAETSRTLYHAALAHGANNLNALITDAVTALQAAIAGPGGKAASTATVDGGSIGLAEQLLAPLVTASLENVLAQGRSALTGPVARGDINTVARHLDELSDVHEGIAHGYRVLAGRAAAQHDSAPALREMLEAHP